MANPFTSGSSQAEWFETLAPAEQNQVAYEVQRYGQADFLKALSAGGVGSSKSYDTFVQKNKPAEIIYKELKGQSQNLGTEKNFQTGASATKEGGWGSTDAVMRDMAKKLADAGLTSIEQFGQGKVPIIERVYAYPEYVNGPVIGYNENGEIYKQVPSGRWAYDVQEGYGDNYYSVKKYLDGSEVERLGLSGTKAKTVEVQTGEKDGFINKSTGEPLTSLTGYDGRGWSGTGAGDGQTIYNVQFDAATGLPIFYNQQKHGRDDYAGLLKIAAIGTAIFAPQIGAALLPAGSSAAAALAVGSAVSGLIGSGGDIKEGIKAGLASYLGGRAGSWASGAANSALVGNIASNMTRAAILGGDMEQALVSSLVQAAPAELSKHIPNFKDLPRAVQETAVAATVDLMRNGGDNLGQIALQGATKGATDYAVSQIDGYKDLRPAQQEIIRTRVSNVLGGESLSDELLQGAISFGQEAVQYQVNDEKAKKAGWEGYDQQQAAKSLYGDKVTPDLYADKQETTEAEAKQIARDILGREPTEFEYMQLIGLSERDAGGMAETIKKDAAEQLADAGLTEDLSPEAADQLLADLGITGSTSPGGGTQYAGADSGISTDAGGQGGDASFAEVKQGIAGYLSGSIGENTGIARLDDGSYSVRDPSNGRVLRFSSDGAYMGTGAYASTSNESTTKIAEDFINAFANSPYAQTFTGTAVVDGSDTGASTGATSGGAGDDAGFWESIGIDPASLSDGDSGLSNDDIMALIGYGQAATPPVDGSGRPLYGDVSGEFGAGELTGFSLVSEDNNAKVYENDGFTLIARANGNNVLLDKTDPDPEPIWLDPVDFSKITQQEQVTPPEVTPPEVTPPVTPSVTPEQVEQIVSDALAENPSLTETQVREIVSDVVSNIPEGITPDTVANIVKDEVATATGGLATKQDVENAIAGIQIPAGLTEADVSSAISEYMKVNPGLSATDVAGAISEYMTANPGLTKTDLDNAVTAATKDFATAQDIESAIAGIEFPAGLSKEDVKFAISDYMAANPGLSLSDVASKITEATSGLATSEGVATAIGNALKGYATSKDIETAIAGIQFPAGITSEDVAAEIKAAMEANPGLSAADVTKSITDYMTANPGLTAADLDTAISAATKDLATTAQLTNLQNSLAEEIQAAKDIGFEGDAAIQAGLDSLAEKVGTNQADLLTQLGTTAADLKAQFATDIAASQEATAQEIADTRTALETAIADAKASGLEGDAALQAAIDAVAADQETNAAGLLEKLGTTEAGLKAEFESGLAGVSAEVADTRKALEDAIKAAQDIGLEGDTALQTAIESVAAELGTTKEALLENLGTTEAALRTDMEAGFAGVATSIADTRTALEAAISDAKAAGLEGDAALQAAIESVAADQQTSAADLLTKLGTTEEGLKTEFAAGLAGVSAEVADTRKALEDAIQAAKDIGLEGDAALQAGIDSVASELGTTKEALLTQLGTTEETLRTEFATGISGLETQMREQYDALTAAQRETADALLAQGETLADAIAEAQATTSGQISDLEAQTTEQYNALTAAQKETADALVEQGKTLSEAVETARAEAAEQLTDTETRLTDAIAAAEAAGLSRDEAITSAVESVAADLGTTKEALLTQLGTTEETLRTEFSTGLAGVSAEVKAAYDSLTAEQKALANQLAQQGVDLTTAIQTAQQETAGQIGALSADVQAKYDSLSAEQKALAANMAQQGMDLTAAIDLAAQQTQAQITGLGEQVDARINELMQQGQTYQEATQQAIGELNTQNQQLQGLVGTQGRQATQDDIDALSQMLGGQRDMDLSYDVTGDKQITQDDIDFLTQVVGGVKTDWTPPVGSAFGPTGLYGQLAANEAQRQADLQAQLAREEAAKQAAAESQRQAAVRTTLGKGQQTLQQIQQQLPQALQQAQQVSTPIYGEMGPYLDLGSPLDFDFFKPSAEKQAVTKQQQPTKIATGGYIDDLLAGDLSVDELLNLLR